MKWTKEKFIKEFGEDPEDMFGPDWEDYVEEYLYERKRVQYNLRTNFGQKEDKNGTH